MNTRSRKLKMSWRFPLPTTHDGILMGNGLFGVCVWGDQRLCLSINRADFWDRRCQRSISAKMNYAALRRVWMAEDMEGLAQLVEEPQTSPAPQIPSPSGLPMGRIDLDLRVAGASLDMADGVLHLTEDGAAPPLKLAVAADRPLLLIETDRTDIDIIRRPAWDFLGDYLSSIGHQPPQMFEQGAISGWLQELPEDPCLCLACARLPGALAITAVHGDTSDQAKANAQALLKTVEEEGVSSAIQSTTHWWQSYWEKIPQINLPSREPEEVYYYGLFKLAGLTKDHPALLQGPWVEEYLMPDCGNDFHFNINVQMCYWPAYAANATELLHPLFDKLKEWEPGLRRNAKLLFGIDDGLFLPMAVTDLGVWGGHFWPSFTDYATTGWTAHLMWLYYRYSMDTDFLRETAYPFMKGAMRVYEAILEEEDGRMVLPMSTSPEYNWWSAFKAAGRNTSFQLACIHFLLESLIAAADLLDVDADDAAAWRQLKEKVPHYATFTQQDTTSAPWSPWGDVTGLPRIALYEGQDLELSHRHHGHLVALYPFDTLDPEEEAFARVLRPTLHRWLEAGPGNWIAFSFVWASIIYSRLKDGEAAYVHYDLWYRLFTNEYRGAVELSRFPGLTTWTNVENSNPMQMDAAMGAVTAIQEMLLHTVRGTLTVFPAVPRAWQKSASFKKMRAEGAFLVSARMKDGHIVKVEIESEKGAPLKLANNIAEEIVVTRARKKERTNTKLLTLDTKPGETITIRPAVTD